MRPLSNLEKHAEAELRLAGLYDKDSDYGGAIAEAVLRLVRTHAAEGHSGGSHALTLSVFNKVINFKTLTPLTSNPAEWMRVDPEQYQPGTWQNLRNASVFSRDGGASWYDIDAPESVHTCAGCKTHFSLSRVGKYRSPTEWYCSDVCWLSGVIK
jgi:hypothetical protein